MSFGAFSRRAMGSGTWVPPTTDGYFWLEASTNRTMHDATIISTLDDRFGGTAVATRATGGPNLLNPTLVAGWRNGRDAFTVAAPSAGNRWGFNIDSAPSPMSQPLTVVSVGSFTYLASFQFTWHSSSAVVLPFYTESGGDFAQYAGTIRSHGSDTDASDLPYIAISVMNGASSTLWIRRQGEADYFGTVAGTVGTNGYASGLRWGGSSASTGHYWRGKQAVLAAYAGAKDLPWQTNMMNGLGDTGPNGYAITE